MEQAIGRIEERYSSAACTSNIDSDNIQSGPAHLLVAAGLAASQAHATEIGRPNASLGHALARLQSEWHSVEKPAKPLPKSIKHWLDVLPMVTIETRPARDKVGAKQAHIDEIARLDDFHAHALRMLAQKLPSRLAVRRELYAVAVLWGWEEPEEKVASVMRHWVHDACTHCNGTGEMLRGAKVQICLRCKGSRKAPVPCGDEGYRLHELMDNSKARWIARVKILSRRLHCG